MAEIKISQLNSLENAETSDFLAVDRSTSVEANSISLQNLVVTSLDPNWQKQLNILLGYDYETEKKSISECLTELWTIKRNMYQKINNFFSKEPILDENSKFEEYPGRITEDNSNISIQGCKEVQISPNNSMVVVPDDGYSALASIKVKPE